MSLAINVEDRGRGDESLGCGWGEAVVSVLGWELKSGYGMAVEG